MHLAKKFLLFVSIPCLLMTNVMANSETLWEDLPRIAARASTEESINNDRGVTRARRLTLNIQAMQSLLVPDENIQARAIVQPTIDLPLPNGSNVKLKLESTQVLPAQLANKFSGIKTFKVAEPNGDIVSGRVDFTELGFRAMLQTVDGKTIFIDPANNVSDANYLSYRKTDQSSPNTFQCENPEEHTHELEAPSPIHSRVAARTRSNEGIIEYRIAIAATAEYTQLQGGTVSASLSAIATTLNRINHVYEQSLGVRFSLVAQNDLLIYTNSSTDPYSNYRIENMLDENQRNIDSVIGSGNYDIGHVFGTAGGGIAYIGSVCSSTTKARGASGIRNPNNDSFDIDYVAHEIGHQFGATHTFNSNQGFCTSGARTARSAFEPGSGSSIMSYAGGCGTDNVQSFADAMFHSGNIEQINRNLLQGSANACGTIHPSNNTAPVAMAGSNHTIPAHTPFALEASAIDADNDPLRYSWEQIDLGAASALKVDTGSNPLFRVLPPTESAIRSFPASSTILGNATINGETLPSTSRTMNFQLAVYDGHHAPSLDRVSINVVNTGASFRLHTLANYYQQGSHFNINWTTANTQNSPVNCSVVDLRLSTNGGKDFDRILATAIPNSGSAFIYLPSEVTSTSTGRFKLSCSNNIFFSISSDNFTIGLDTPPATSGTRNTILAESLSSSGGGSASLTLFILLLMSGLRKIAKS